MNVYGYVKSIGWTRIISVIVMLGWASGAYAQSATEGFLPATVRIIAPDANYGSFAPEADYGSLMATSLVPDNPAAVMWGEADRVGAGSIVHTVDNDAGLLGNPLSITGNFGGASLIWDRVVMSMDWIDLSLTHPNRSMNQNRRAFRLGFKVAEFLNFGVSTASRRASSINNDQADPWNMELRSTEDVLGFSLRVNSWLHLGYAAGKEEMRRKDHLTGALYPDLLMERTVNHVGAAIRTQGTHRIYAAAGLINKGDFGLGLSQRIKLIYGTTQVVLWDHFLLAGGTSDLVDNNPNVLQVSTVNSDIGWISNAGYSLTARYTRTDTQEEFLLPTTMKKNQVNATRMVSLSWMF